MNFDLINVLKFSLIGKLIVGVILCIVLILDADLSVFIVLASEQDMLLWLNLQVVAATERMHLSFETFGVLDHSGAFVADGDDVDTMLRND